MSKSAVAERPEKVLSEEKVIGELHPDGLKEITYRCANKDCRHEQVIRYFAGQPAFAVVACVKCRAGIQTQVDLARQIELGIGMFPVQSSERRFER